MVRLGNKQSTPGGLQRQAKARPALCNHASGIILQHAVHIAEEGGAAALFVSAEALADQEWKWPRSLAGKVFYIVKPSDPHKFQIPAGQQVVNVPAIQLGRMDQVKIAVLSALSHGLLKRGDVIACAVGAPKSGETDTVILLQIDKEFDLFYLDNTNLHLPPDVNPGVLDKVIKLATEMAAEGREGVSRGTILVVGDTERVLSFSKQLIMNPFKGYAEEERNILDPSLDETIKELAAIDGAFVLRGDGVIETAGTYLKFAPGSDPNLRPGLGTRHQAAAGITGVTRAIAVTVSQSTGAVSVFRNGLMLMEIERQ